MCDALKFELRFSRRYVHLSHVRMELAKCRLFYVHKCVCFFGFGSKSVDWQGHLNPVYHNGTNQPYPAKV